RVVDIPRGQLPADRGGAAVFRFHVCGGGQLYRPCPARVPYRGETLSADVADLSAGGGHLCELLRASLAAGYSRGAIYRDGADFRTRLVLVQDRPQTAVHALAAGLFPCGAIYLDCRKFGHLRAGMDLSRSG